MLYLISCIYLVFTVYLSFIPYSLEFSRKVDGPNGTGGGNGTNGTNTTYHRHNHTGYDDQLSGAKSYWCYCEDPMNLAECGGPKVRCDYGCWNYTRHRTVVKGCVPRWVKYGWDNAYIRVTNQPVPCCNRWPNHALWFYGYYEEYGILEYKECLAKIFVCPTRWTPYKAKLGCKVYKYALSYYGKLCLCEGDFCNGPLGNKSVRLKNDLRISLLYALQFIQVYNIIVFLLQEKSQ